MAGGERKVWRIDAMDAPLQAAVARAGGRRPFFRALGGTSRAAWTTTPKERLFDVARISGMDPRELRPDLVDWIDAEILRREFAEAGGGAAIADLAESLESRWDGPVIAPAITDLWASFASVMWVARERRMTVQRVCYGVDEAAQEARAYAMALAHVAGRASSTNVANVFGCTRQNVDGASARYQRARDGDDADDHIQGQWPDGKARVLELASNRLRLAKGPDPQLWAAEVRFEKFLRGEDLAVTPEPRRARA